MIFLDTSYIVGLVIKNDNYSDKSLKLKSYLKNEKKLINNTVFNEVLNSLTSFNSEYSADSLSNLLLSYDVNFLSADDYAESISLFKYYNCSINFSDCTILNSMIKNNVNTIVSFDSDFDKINGIHRIYI